jgi:hypothetical protein
LFFFLLAQASSHNVPYKTNLILGLRCVGGLFVFLLSWIFLKLVHRKQDGVIGPTVYKPDEEV